MLPTAGLVALITKEDWWMHITNAHMSKTRRFLLLGFIILGAVVGALFIPPNISDNILLRGGSGAILGLLLGILMIPELRNNYLDIWKRNGFHLMFTHPTQLPLMLGMMWFIGVGAFVILSGVTFTLGESTLFLFLPTTFLLGFSGFMMAIREEYILFTFSGFTTIQGKVAMLRGIVVMIIFWGLGIFFILSEFF